MAFGSFFTRALDVVTPWNRGGEVQRRQERKKREEQQWAQRTYRNNNPRASVSVASRGPEVSVEGQDEPKPKQPENIFETLNKNLVFNKPQNTVPILSNKDNQPYEPPKPGVVVTPTQQTPRISEVTTAAPQNLRAVNSREVIRPAPGLNTKPIMRPEQTAANRFTDIFDANTEADKFRRANEAQKELVKRGVSPVFAQRAIEQSPDALRRNNFTPSVINFVKDAITSAGRGVRAVTVNPIESGRELVASKTKNKEAEKAAQYRKNVAFYGKETADRLARGEEVSFGDTVNAAFDTLAVLPLAKGASMLESGVRESFTNRTAIPAVKQLLAGLDEAFLGVRDIGRKKPRSDISTQTVDDLLSEADIADINTTNVPVRQGVEVNGPVDNGVNIPVRNANTPTPIIQEIGGDAKTVTSNAQAAQNAVNARRVEAAKRADTGLPDRSIDGVTSRTPEKPFAMNPEEVAFGQDKIVKDYAKTLRGLGEGNGVTITPDGRRLSNNVRSVENKGKRMTKADWEDEARRQLESGQGEPSAQQAFNDAKDPEVQSLLNQGEQAPVPEGRPIKVQQAKGIDVIDQTNVPQNLPETPGKVRVTSSKEPVKIKSEAVAAEAPPPPDPVGFTKDGKPIYDRSFETSPDGTTKVKTATPKQANEGSELENLVKNLRENQKAYKGEKKLRKAEFGRRQAQKQKLYEQYRAEGMSGQEAKRAADKALGGQYTKSFASNPEVSEKTVNEILDKTKGDQNTQNAFARWFDPNRPEALRDWERTRIRQYFQKELGEDAAQAVDEAIVMAERAGERSVGGKIADFMTSSIAAGDISAVGRQGLSGLINHPKMSKGAWGDALKALMNSDGEKKFAAELTKNPNVAFIQEHMGGKFLTLSDVADEGRGMDVANKATSWYVNPSNRHYNTYLDSLRLRQKEAIINRYGGQEGFLKAASDANPDNPEKWMKAWNNVIDRQSGRGSFSNFGSPTVGDMQVLFSARNLASKFQRLTAPLQLGLAYRNPAAYIYQLKETAAQAAALGATLAAIKASGIADIENGKIKIGKTRIDITGGFATLIKAADDVRKSMGIGHDTSEDKGFKRSGFTVATDFFQNQLAPTLGSLAKFANVDWGKGEDKFGNKIDAKWWAGVVPMPAVAQTAIQSTLQGENPLEVARNVALDAVGFNTTTYESSADKEAPKTNETKDILKQLKQEGIGVSTEDVDNYVADGDFEKASRVAEYNLKKLQSDPKTGSAEIKKAEKALEDFTVRKEGIPTTDDGITAKVENGDWDTAIKGYELKLKKANQDGELSKKTEKAIQNDMERVRVLRDNGFEPGLFSAYKDTSLPEWLKMGDPESEDYDPETYQKLWEIDQKMTEKKVSNKEGDSEKPKYSAKAAGKGRGGRGGSRGGSSQRAIDTSFGALKDMSFIPKAKEYASIDSQSGSVPIIRKVRPNIVHKITSSG